MQHIPVGKLKAHMRTRTTEKTGIEFIRSEGTMRRGKEGGGALFGGPALQRAGEWDKRAKEEKQARRRAFEGMREVFSDLAKKLVQARRCPIQLVFD